MQENQPGCAPSRLHYNGCGAKLFRVSPFPLRNCSRKSTSDFVPMRQKLFRSRTTSSAVTRWVVHLAASLVPCSQQVLSGEHPMPQQHPFKFGNLHMHTCRPGTHNLLSKAIPTNSFIRCQSVQITPNRARNPHSPAEQANPEINAQT